MLTFKRSLAVISCLLLLMMPSVASAATKTPSKSSPTTTTDTGTNGSTSQSVTQGYAADTTTQKGMIVSLDPKNSSKVLPLTTDNADHMLGVVVAANDATVTLSEDSNNGQVFVASFGRYDVLVSTQNGPIKAGDYITISSLAGIGMKVDTSQPVVLGRAQASFTGTGAVDGTTQLKTTNGTQVTVALGRIPVDVSISHNPLQESVDKGLPTFLKKASEQIAGRQVGTARVYIGLSVLIVTSLIAGAMLYSGIRGGLIAIGRNPLAKKQIVGGIFRVVLSGVIVFLLGIFGVYLILKL